MAHDTPHRDVTTADTFSRILQELLLAAHENGVEVAGGWECRSNEPAPDWEVVVTELAEETGRSASDAE